MTAAKPAAPVELTENEIWPLMDTWTDRLHLFEGVVKVKPACILFIRDLREWRVNLATTVVDVPEPVEFCAQGGRGDPRFLG